MQILLASTVMVVAGVSVLIVFTLRIWSRAHEARFNDMRKQIEGRMAAIESAIGRMAAIESAISDTQAVLGDLRYKVEVQGEKGSSQDA